MDRETSECWSVKTEPKEVIQITTKVKGYDIFHETLPVSIMSSPEHIDHCPFFVVGQFVFSNTSGVVLVCQVRKGGSGV